MLGERIASQSEVIRAIGLGDSPCNGPALGGGFGRCEQGRFMDRGPLTQADDVLH